MKTLLPVVTLLLACTALAVPGKTAEKEKSAATKPAKVGKNDLSKQADMPAVLDLAKKEKKLAYVQIGREGCGNCRQIKASLESGDYVLPKNFVRAELDCDDAKVASDLRSRYGNLGTTLPFLLFVDAEGNLLAKSGGFVTKAQFADLVKEATKKSKEAKKTPPAETKPAEKK